MVSRLTHPGNQFCIDVDLFKVVLLDEADVFLEQRTLADLQRNALVSGVYPLRRTENL